MDDTTNTGIVHESAPISLSIPTLAAMERLGLTRPSDGEVAIASDSEVKDGD